MPWSRALLLALAAGILTTAVFWPAARGGFVWDDPGLITKRHDTLDEWSDVAAAFGRAATAGEGVAYYRPVMIATFVADARLFGFEAPVFHRTNVVLHGLNVGLVVLLLAAFGCGPWAAVAGALLFGLHPLQCQAVALILGRNDVLLVPPVALMLFADEVVRRGGRRLLADALVVLGFAVTLWTKETGIVAPLFLLLLDLLWRRWPLASLRDRIPLFAAFAVVTVLYFATRLVVIGAIFDAGHYGYTPILARPARAAAILGYYVQHVFLPWGAAPAPWHAGRVDPARPELWIAVATSAAFIGLTWFAWRRNARVACGLAMFGGALLPVLALVAPMKVLILDHRTYLPFLGLAFSAGAWNLATRTGAARAVTAVVLAAFAVLTANRLPSYADALSLWRLAVEAEPSSDYARNNYGAALMDADKFPEAVEQFREALRLNPSYDKPRFNLAGCLEYLGDRPQALREMEILVERRPTDTASLTRLALMRTRGGDLTGAEAAWSQAVAAKPNDPILVRNLADTLERRGNVAAAIPLRRRMIDLEPANAMHWAILGRDLIAVGNVTEAIEAYERAIAGGIQNGQLHAQFALALFQAGRWNDAAVQVRKGRDLGYVDPTLVQRLSEVGVAIP